MKVINQSRKQSHKSTTESFPFSSDSAYDSVAYDLVRTRLWELEREAEGYKPIAMPIPTLFDWFSSSASVCDSDSLVST